VAHSVTSWCIPCMYVQISMLRKPVHMDSAPHGQDHSITHLFARASRALGSCRGKSARIDPSFSRASVFSPHPCTIHFDIATMRRQALVENHSFFSVSCTCAFTYARISLSTTAYRHMHTYIGSDCTLTFADTCACKVSAMIFSLCVAPKGLGNPSARAYRGLRRSSSSKGAVRDTTISKQVSRVSEGKFYTNITYRR
jgi:hypothetical protein